MNWFSFAFILVPPQIQHISSGGHLQVKKGTPVRIECIASGECWFLLLLISIDFLSLYNFYRESKTDHNMDEKIRKFTER